MSNVSEVYETLKSLVDGERGNKFRELMKFIETETDYLISPASTKYHLSVPEGLIYHSCSVTKTMIKMMNSIAPDIGVSKCVIVGLLHDLGKVGLPGMPLYIENEPTEKQKKYGYPASTPYSYNSEIIHTSVPARSLYLVMPRFELELDEYQAILYHDGQYIDDNKSVAHKETKLLMLLHHADIWSTRFLEDIN